LKINKFKEITQLSKPINVKSKKKGINSLLKDVNTNLAMRNA